MSSSLLPLIAVLAGAAAWHLTNLGATQSNTPTQAAFVGSETCKGCHTDKHSTWLTTAHAYALREASSESIAGQFDGQPVKTPFFTATPYRRDDQYWIRVQRHDGGAWGDHSVSRVVGKSFEQAYLFTGPRGEWRILPICWSLERKQWDWTHRVLADINGDPGSLPESYDSREKIFNDGCGQCHATHYDIGYDSRQDRYASQFLEGAVSCESCHGPGAEHVRWHRRKKSGGEPYRSPARLLHPARDLQAPGVLASCGRCHYKHDWRYAIDENPRVGFQEIAISRNHDGLGFFADGKVSGLNYHGTTQSQSACFRGGMSCLSCHQMHSGKPYALRWEETADTPCASCHRPLVSASQSHSRHQNLRCVDCHMPKLMTGVLHFMRDHSLSSPEPELTEKFGKEQAPNACAQCHSQPAAWARQWKEKWWKPADPSLIENVGTVVALRKERTVETKRLVNMAEGTANQLFFRLTAVDQLARRRSEESRAALRRLLSDSHEEVRQLAALGIGSDPHPEAAADLVRTLADPSRIVRLESGFALARCGWRGSSPAMERIYQDAAGMLNRQRRFDDVSERLVVLADALEHTGEMTEHLAHLSGKTIIVQTAGELLHRHGRNLLEQGDAKQALHYLQLALEHYRRAPQSVGRDRREWISLDLADTFASLGQLSDARGQWQQVTAPAGSDSLSYDIAALRLETPGKTDLKRRQLAARVEALKSDPASGELRRRALWSLRELK